MQNYYTILTMFLRLHITSLWLIHFLNIIGGLYLLIPFICFAQPPTPSWQPSVCPLCQQLYFCFVVFVTVLVTSYNNCFSLSDISLSMMLSRSIRDGEHGRISFFLGLNHILLYKTALPCKLQSSIKGLIKGCF